MKTYAYTDIGIARPDNQDSYLIMSIGDNGVLAGVFDGIGGLSHGGRASQELVKTIHERVSSAVSSGQTVQIEDYIQEAGQRIQSWHNEDNKLCGSTCTVAVIESGEGIIYHTGDSRAYIIHGDARNFSAEDGNQVTEDMTAWNMYQKNGIKVDQNRVDLAKRTLTSAVGVKPDITIEKYPLKVGSGDQLVLCSDGFWHLWSEGAVMPEDSRMGISIPDMIAKDKAEGEKDNITAVCVEF